MSYTHSNRVGLITRVFSNSADPTNVVKKSGQVISLARRAVNLESEGNGIISRVDIMIPSDPRYADCDQSNGTLEAQIREEIRGHGLGEQVFVCSLAHGDIFCATLNNAFARQKGARINASFVVSPEVLSHLTLENVDSMVQCLEKGHVVAGLALNELADSIKAGLIANTFALWHTAALMTVGMFDFQAAQPMKDDKIKRFLQGETAPDGKESFYPIQGVEEIIPLVRLKRTYGEKAIAAVVPKVGGEWAEPTEPAELKRHKAKMASKLVRQTWMSMRADADLSYLSATVYE